MPYYHVWLSPKKRKPILEGEIGEIAQAELLQVASSNGIGLLECERCYDHVHMLLDLIDGQSLASVMHQLKGASAHGVFQRTPELKVDIGHVSLWQRGYGYRRVERSELPRLRWYIRKHREDSEPRVFNPRGGS